jgi:3-phenylpropionate/trans-cinnamate dioxygenase ferredoxin reductase component
MTAPASVLIAGGGLAGLSAARTLRELGYDGTIGLVDPAPLPYDRPPLSKAFLLGTAAEPDLLLVPEQWYADNRVDVVGDTVSRLDPGAGRVELSSGKALTADSVVLAVGGRGRMLDIPGADLPSVLTLRTVDDARRLRSRLVPGSHIVIVGAGLIGAEVASSARALGADVTLVDPVAVPLEPAVGTELATRLHRMHGEAGITVVQDRPTAIAVEGTAHLVNLAAGPTIEADVVLSAVGIAADTTIAESARLEVDAGIVVDPRQRTSNPAVLAVGDIARVRTTDGTLCRRTEHWEAAMQSGQRAARTILGQEPGPAVSAWFWSDRHGVHVEASGDMASPGTTVRRDIPGGGTVVFHLDGEQRLVGAAAIDGGSTFRAARKIVERGRAVDPSTLSDPATDLRKLAR